jgi:hypothetical protein
MTLPQHRESTRTSGRQIVLYTISAVIVLAATVDPTWAKWQAVLMGIGLGSTVATAVRDAWWRKQLGAPQ